MENKKGSWERTKEERERERETRRKMKTRGEEADIPIARRANRDVEIEKRG